MNAALVFARFARCARAWFDWRIKDAPLTMTPFGAPLTMAP